MEVKRALQTSIAVYRPDLIKMLKAQFPTDLSIKALPDDGKDVGVELSGTMVKLSFTRTAVLMNDAF